MDDQLRTNVSQVALKTGALTPSSLGEFALLPGGPIIALGGKAQHRGSRRVDVISGYALDSPGLNRPATWPTWNAATLGRDDTRTAADGKRQRSARLTLILTGRSGQRLIVSRAQSGDRGGPAPVVLSAQQQHRRRI